MTDTLPTTYEEFMAWALQQGASEEQVLRRMALSDVLAMNDMTNDEAINMLLEGIPPFKESFIETFNDSDKDYIQVLMTIVEEEILPPDSAYNNDGKGI